MLLKRLKFMLSIIILFLIWNCSAMEPYEYESERDQKSGPGLFSGEKGAFTIYESTKPKPEDGKGSETQEKDPDETEKSNGG